MELKTKARLAMGSFLAACLIPSAGMLVLPEGTAAANQQLAAPPSLTLEDGSFNPEVFQEVTDYIADHFALRQELITADAALNAAVFHISAEEKVTLGREGWLFYAETVDDHLRTSPLTDRQLWAGAHTLGLIQEYVEARGGRLLFTVAPNKATIYPEYLPDVGKPLEGAGNLDRLIPLLEGEGIAYADLREPLQGENTFLYYRLDSHWNTLGAALAQVCWPGCTVAFRGDLGAGKTAFVRGMARGLDCPERVTSPTFTIVNEYEGGRLPLFHFDMYRLENAGDLFDIGWEDYLDRGGVCAVEWSERVEEALPEDAVTVSIARSPEDERWREITIEGVGEL